MEDLIFRGSVVSNDFSFLIFLSDSFGVGKLFGDCISVYSYPLHYLDINSMIEYPSHSLNHSSLLLRITKFEVVVVVAFK